MGNVSKSQYDLGKSYADLPWGFDSVGEISAEVDKLSGFLSTRKLNQKV